MSPRCRTREPSKNRGGEREKTERAMIDLDKAAVRNGQKRVKCFNSRLFACGGSFLTSGIKFFTYFPIFISTLMSTTKQSFI
jgi:hypothetical protein